MNPIFLKGYVDIQLGLLWFVIGSLEYHVGWTSAGIIAWVVSAFLVIIGVVQMYLANK
jgi:uncharacterized membrane protein (GlpM family)